MRDGSWGVLVLAMAAACAPADREPDGAPVSRAIQLNDVSVLFPLVTGDLDASYVPASDVVPESIYDRVGPITGSGPASGAANGTAPFANLRLVGLRLDPCFGALEHDPHGDGCTNQLRLVFQEIGPDGAYDSALHVFYDLSHADLVAFARGVADLRIARSSGERLGALAPHPIMAREGLRGPMAEGVRDLVRRYALPANISRVATLTTPEPGDWDFAVFSVQAGVARPIAIPSLDQPVQLFTRGYGEAGVGGRLYPPPDADDSFLPIFYYDNLTALDAADVQADLTKLVHVDDPRRHSMTTIDCGSCHLATPVSRVGQIAIGFDETTDPLAYQADGIDTLPSELTATFDPSVDLGPSVNVHAFSYDGMHPGISQRTANDSASVAMFVNSY